MAHKNRRTQKFRGSRSHGYGCTKKHRGAGSHGGRGMGGGKKQKWTYVSKFMPGHFGGKGFKTHTKKVVVKAINLETLAKLLDEGKIKTKEKTLDLTELGYDKLLGSGKLTKPLVIKVNSASKSAVEKIEKTGGKVELPEAKAAEVKPAATPEKVK